MSWTDDYREAGGSIADAVAAMLRDATLTSALTKISDSSSVPEPTVLCIAGYERDEIASGDERGAWELELWVCREKSGIVAMAATMRLLVTIATDLVHDSMRHWYTVLQLAGTCQRGARERSEGR